MKNGKEMRETKQTIMEHAMTGQNNLNADADRAGSFNQDCKGTVAQNKKMGELKISKPKG